MGTHDLGVSEEGCLNMKSRVPYGHEHGDKKKGSTRSVLHLVGMEKKKKEQR